MIPKRKKFENLETLQIVTLTMYITITLLTLLSLCNAWTPINVPDPNEYLAKFLSRALKDPVSYKLLFIKYALIEYIPYLYFSDLQ